MLVLGLFGGTLVQANVRHCLRLFWGNLFEATSDPQFVIASARPGCVREIPSSAPRPIFISTRTKASWQKF